MIKPNDKYFEITDKPRGYYEIIEVYYLDKEQKINQLVVSEFLNQYKQIVGQYFLMIDVKGNIYYNKQDLEVRN